MAKICGAQLPESPGGSGALPWRSTRLPVLTRKTHALGTNVTLTVLHPDEQAAAVAIEASFGALQLVEQVMSLYQPASQLAQLNRNRVLLDPHPHLVTVLRVARAMSQRTEGAFDVTVQPLWQLYREAHTRGDLPSPAEVEQTRRLVGWRNVEISSRAIKLQGKGTAITLNGIAQGFAADLVRKTLRDHGVQHALIDTGELSAMKCQSDASGWQVGIQHPRLEDAYVSLAQLADRCLATSGDYATTFSADYRHNHLLDPHTGRSPTELSSVSIAARTALEADALSTAAFVLGAEEGLRLINDTAGADALFVLKDGHSLATAGFPGYR